ncbi:ABC transporter permease [Pseudomonas sp. L13]|uniref:ABC transporter permease n=1 Tax=Pseudomonas sp. L13 TaxID=343985 RepID=UPI00137A5DDF|nr:ABC transporter permease [Pseudomonas sp. L13]NCE89193.1 ABC transporter permease [Pseudomonas sp. L13]
MSSYNSSGQTKILAVLTIVFMLFPLAVVIPVSFTSKRFLSMPDGNWSLRHYQALVSDEQWLHSIGQSLLIGLLTCVLASLLVLAFSLSIWYMRSKLATVGIGIAMLPMIMPPVISAMILYYMETAMSSVHNGFGYDSIFGVTLAHVIMVLPFGVITMMVSLGQLDRRVEMAARNLGASLWQTIGYVILPNLKFGIAATALLSFALSWEEVAVTLFITSVDVVTLPKQIWGGLRDNVNPSVAALSVILISITFLILVTKSVVQARYERGADK